jgi:methionine-rich copper-binding protein CopC
MIGTAEAPVRPRRSPWRKAGAILVAAVAIAVGALVILVETKPADLTGVSPADGTTVAAAPAQVSVDFTANPNPQQFHVTAAAPDGASVASGPARVDGNRIVLPVRIARHGTYQVAYHVVTGDGQELTGQSRFTVTRDGAGGSAAEAPPPPNPLDHSAHGVDPSSLVLLAIDVGLTATLAVFMLRRRRAR